MIYGSTSYGQVEYGGINWIKKIKTKISSVLSTIKQNIPIRTVNTKILETTQLEKTAITTKKSITTLISSNQKTTL